MTSSCIHGFSADQCAACRSCPHGLAAARCGRCVSITAAAALRSASATAGHNRAEEHRGFEIFYAPEVSGWRFRAPGSDPSPVSYRSTFLARKAIDAIGTGTGDPAAATRPVTKPS